MLNVVQNGPVVTVTLDRPEVRNAFNDELIQALSETFTSVEDDVRAIVLAGNGPAFCAGGDLQWMRKAADYSDEENIADALRLARLFEAMMNCPAVIVAAIHGAAFGGGCGLVAAADVAIAGDKALFAFSEVRLGLVPATISPFVVAKIGNGHARALFTTGEAFGSERALRIGLVHEVVANDELDAAVTKQLKLILSAGPRAVASAKKLAQEAPLSLEEAARWLAAARESTEGREGVSAFLEKRAPGFKVEL